MIPIRLIKLAILREKNRVDSKAKIYHLVILNDKFLTQFAPNLPSQDD